MIREKPVQLIGQGKAVRQEYKKHVLQFTGANGEPPKAFFVVPLVGSLFIGFIYAIIIMTFMQFEV